MKFSYPTLQRSVEPKSKEELIDNLLMKAFETEDVSKDVIDCEIPHNRYADGASHLGVAREYAAISGKKLKEPEMKKVFHGKTAGINVSIKDTKLCPRYGAAEFELKKKGVTPAWMKKSLKDCGLRPIHPVVDILNYVMLEVGQPLHAFDAAKLNGGIIVRKATKNEKITTIFDVGANVGQSVFKFRKDL